MHRFHNDLVCILETISMLFRAKEQLQLLRWKLGVGINPGNPEPEPSRDGTELIIEISMLLASRPSRTNETGSEFYYFNPEYLVTSRSSIYLCFSKDRKPSPSGN